jgi:diacylglycerol kinase
MSNKGKRGLRRILDATGYSATGLAIAWRSEEAFRQEVLLAVALITCSPAKPRTWAAVFLGLVLAALAWGTIVWQRFAG